MSVAGCQGGFDSSGRHGLVMALCFLRVLSRLRLLFLLLVLGVGLWPLSSLSMRLCPLLR